jgi:hypothetical protein
MKYKICEILTEILMMNRVFWEDDSSSSEIRKSASAVLLLPLLHLIHSVKEAAK